MLRSTATASERPRLLRGVHRTYAAHLDKLDQDLDKLNLESLSSDDVLTFFEVLQDLKQPSLEDNIELPVPRTTPAEPTADAFSWDDEALITDDFSRSPDEDWRERVAQRLSSEDALCLDFFLTNKQLYCFVTDHTRGQLHCRLLSLGVHEKGKGRDMVQAWRARFRSIAVEVDSYPQQRARWLERQLRHNRFLPGPLADLLRQRHARTLYVAPFLGLHGLPLHAMRTPDGWSLSDVGPVLSVAKTRQLAAPCPAPSGNIQILTGPEASFQHAGQQLAERLRATVTTPSTWAEARAVLRESKIAVLLGHGWFDPERPARSRVALDHGLRLTLKDMQTLGLEGTEVVLLSCWMGWSIRGTLPIGELYHGPTAWMVGGAGAVLAPLWPVHIKAATEFLGDYLEARGCGETRATALHRARQQSDKYPLGGTCRAAYVLWGLDSP
jgi:hypothetical protein